MARISGLSHLTQLIFFSRQYFTISHRLALKL
jgi:hypothetical protein